MNIIEGLDDPAVFGRHFRGSTWAPWRAFLAALFALPMSDEQLELYRKHTGRQAPPAQPSFEAWLCCGRRSGKSTILALIACYVAMFKDWRPYLRPGEVGTVMIIAADRLQARTIMRFIVGLLEGVPMFKRQIVSKTRTSITLKQNLQIEIHTASFRTTRSYTCVCCLLDEIAYWPTAEDSAESDAEVLNALRPTMATIPQAMLLCASSPYARKGALWEAHRKHFGRDGDPVLVWQAPTRAMNAGVPERFIDDHIEADPARASAEYLALFRSDLEGYVSEEIVEACVTIGVHERAPQPRSRYVAFVDPAGGSGTDSFTLAVGHLDRDTGRAVLDCLRERRPPFSPEAVVAEFAQVLKLYGVTRVTGDRYGGEFPRELFRRHHITYAPSEKSKSELYREALALLNSNRCELLDHNRLISQFTSLERRTTRGSGRELIDHPAHMHDDLSNSCAGVLLLVQETEKQRILVGSYNPHGGGVVTWEHERPRSYVVPLPDGGIRIVSDNSCWTEEELKKRRPTGAKGFY